MEIEIGREITSRQAKAHIILFNNQLTNNQFTKHSSNMSYVQLLKIEKQRTKTLLIYPKSKTTNNLRWVFLAQVLKKKWDELGFH